MQISVGKALLAGGGILAIAAAAASCGKGQQAQAPAGASASLKELMQARGLSETDVEAALKTYVPGGKYDDYIIFASGGHSGQVLVIGVPSMRLLKVIGVFTPEPWQGYGFGGEADKVLAAGNQGNQKLAWADIHHPNLSETNGDYDGKFLFVNDKANGRVGVIDLSDFVTKQIVPNPLVGSDHGGAFVDPNTNYVIETSAYPAPLGRALLCWLMGAALHDFALIGAMLRLRLAPSAVFALAAANPVEAARVALLSGVDPELGALGPVGFWLANSFGPRFTLLVGVGWPLLLGSLCLGLAGRRLARADLV